MEIKNFGGITVIDDSYNSAPDSIRAALKVLQKANAKRKVAVLGDVLEMGEFAEKELYDIGINIGDIDALITVGENAGFIAKGAELFGVKTVQKFDSTDDAIAYLNEFTEEGDNVLVKASRGMHFENIVDALKEKWEI